MIELDAILLVGLMLGHNIMNFFLFIFIFLLCSSSHASSASSKYICNYDFLNKNTSSSNAVNLQLTHARQDEPYGLYSLSNLGKHQIILQGWYQKPNIFTLYGHDQKSWKLSIKNKNSRWEKLAFPYLLEYAPPDSFLSIKPNESVVFMAEVQGINEFDVDLNKFAYKLIIKTRAGEQISSVPYCFNLVE